VSAAGEEKKIEALIKLEVACRLALEALPHAPAEDELREPIQALCDLTERELDRIKPGWKDA
jgi:adenylosuccinate lyase